MNLYRTESSDPTVDAQRNLSWRTHYVDPSSLRFHYSRILSTQVLADGLLFGIVESVAIDPDNKRRGYRGVIFDLFGTVLSRRPLEQSLPSREKAERDLLNSRDNIDAIAHTLEAIKKARRSYKVEMDQLTLKVEQIASNAITNPEATT